MEVPVTIRDSKQGSRKQTIQVLVEEKSPDQQLQGKRLHILLTDPSDPFFFFSLIITEGDFQNLKRQQNLRVDFGSFASMIKDLVAKCVEDAGSDLPKFSLLLDCEDGQGLLNFQEVSPYSLLCHLALKVCRGSDHQVKDYLAECVKKLQTENSVNFSVLSSRVKLLESELLSATSRLKDKCDESERARRVADDQSTNFSARLLQEITAEKERSVLAIAEMQTRHDLERQKLVDNQARILRDKENRIASLEYENKDFITTRAEHDAKIKMLTGEVRHARDENARLKMELNAKRSENNKLDTDFNQKERTISQLQTRLSILEQENLRLQTELGKQRELYNIVNEQKIRLDRDLSDKTALVLRRETAVRNVSQELVKANEIIKKFQDQVKIEHHKVKLGAKAIEEHERLLSVKDAELNTIREELKIATEKLSEVKTAKLDLDISCKRLQEEIGDLEKKLRTDEAVIHWLNKQLTTAQARDPSLRLAPPPEGITTFTPSGMRASSTPLDQLRPHTMGRSNNSQDESVQLRPSRRSVEKENTPIGLDEKYLQSVHAVEETSRGLLRQNNSNPSSVLPSNVRSKPARGGLLRKPPPAAASSKSNPPNIPGIESVYFPRT